MDERNGCPVSEGEIYTLTIEKIGSKGDGFGKIDGYVIFVPDTTVGEKVKVKITRVLPRVAFAEKVIQD